MRKKIEQPEKKNPYFGKPQNIIHQSQFEERNWLIKHGKKDYIQFNEDEISELRKYFSSLDEDGSGSIGVVELEDPLIALGLAQNRDDVIKLINAVDDDQSGQIEFAEFMKIMSQVSEDQDDQSAIYVFFKKMVNGEFKHIFDQNLPFKLNVSQYRRKKILDAIICIDQKKKDDGIKILQAFKKQINQQRKSMKAAGQKVDLDASLDQIPNNENGVNTRNGFPKLPKIIKVHHNNLIKPKSILVKQAIPQQN